LFASVFGELASPWDLEFSSAKKAGFSVGLYDEVDFTTKANVEGKLVLFRGWMMSFEQYTVLCDNIASQKGTALIPPTLFQRTNSFSSWYYRLPKYTMKSFFVREDENMLSNIESLFANSSHFFIKDNLKSLGKTMSVASSPEDALLIYNNIKSNRDFEIKNNGVCLREVTEVVNKERFFILDGEIVSYGEHSSASRIALVRRVFDILLSKAGMFAFCIDIASSNGRDIVLEIGDFQVSDITKEGNAERVESFYLSLSENDFAKHHSG
jgi:hypothetical protein